MELPHYFLRSCSCISRSLSGRQNHLKLWAERDSIEMRPCTSVGGAEEVKIWEGEFDISEELLVNMRSPYSTSGHKAVQQRGSWGESMGSCFLCESLARCQSGGEVEHGAKKSEGLPATTSLSESVSHPISMPLKE